MRLRLMAVNHTGLFSGAERSLLDLLSRLSSDVALVIVSPKGEFSQRVLDAGHRHVPIPAAELSFRFDLVRTPGRMWSALRTLRRLATIVSQEHPDLIVSNSVRAGLLMTMIPRRRSTRLVVWVRDVLPNGRVASVVRRLVWLRADAVLANSQYVARSFDDPRTAGRATVVYNGIDPIQSDEAAAGASAYAPSGTLRLAVIGQITPWKRQDLAIRVVRHLLYLGIDATLDLIGTVEFAGPGRYDTLAYDGQLRRLVSELGVSERVRFLGRREDARMILAHNHVLLVPSDIEPFGRVVIDGMLARNVVIARDIAGPAEILKHGVTGLLIGSANAVDWGASIAHLVSDWERSITIIETAQAVARERFGADRMARRFREVVMSTPTG